MRGERPEAALDIVLDEIGGSMPDEGQLVRIALRLLAALLVGALIGLQRELTGKAAGLRTHMLVALGTAIFVISAAETGMGEDAMSRVIQGIVTGIGFLGAGAILKLADSREIYGLTTAAGIWITAAASVAVGLGLLTSGLLGAVIGWIVLAGLGRLEKKLEKRAAQDPDPPPD